MEICIHKVCFNKEIILNNINITINEGDLIHIIGKNGAGKSTFFKVLLGELSYSGYININSTDIAVVADYASIPKEMYVRDIINFLKKYHKNYDKNMVKKLSEITLINDITNRKVNKLSSGEKRKLEIYSTLFSGKRVVIFDEVTNALDDTAKRNIIKLIVELRKEFQDIIIFYTSHDIRETIELGGRYFFVNKEKKLFYEKVIFNEEELLKEYAYL
ncbi:MAG: ATP-binding cassette domain-containing protein [Anaerocolumna sp.]